MWDAGRGGMSNTGNFQLPHATSSQPKRAPKNPKRAPSALDCRRASPKARACCPWTPPCSNDHTCILCPLPNSVPRRPLTWAYGGFAPNPTPAAGERFALLRPSAAQGAAAPCTPATALLTLPYPTLPLSYPSLSLAAARSLSLAPGST